MKKFLNVIKRASIFRGMTDIEIESIIRCLGARIKSYNKGEYILRVGDSPESAGLLLSGSVLVMQEDFWGKRNIRSHMILGQIFAESFACVPEAVMDVNVIADKNCDVLWLNVQRILHSCMPACTHHNRMIHNLLSDLAINNLRINEKFTHISKRTTREKLLSYLSTEAQHQGKPEFTIPFNRQQLADYLSVERSAMSAELSKMQKDGLLTMEKNFFSLR